LNTKLLMVVCSGVLALAGGAATFAPAETLAALGAPTVEPLPVMMQLLGGLYLAFAITNWTAKDNRIGGIYSRPLALGNLLHFGMGALALGKHAYRSGMGALLLSVLGVYCALALGFAYLVFGRGAASKAGGAVS
jgi:hypothetical protein